MLHYQIEQKFSFSYFWNLCLIYDNSVFLLELSTRDRIKFATFLVFPVLALLVTLS